METREDVLAWLNSRLTFGIKPGLSRMEWMLNRLGLEEMPSVHVAGTNGKGSTVAFLRAMAQAEGKRVGTFISPYIITFEERIMLGGEPIGEADLVRIANRVRELSKEAPEEMTEFELLTVIAWLYFDEKRPDLVIWEVGLGGRLDSTNVLKRPLATVVTSIGYDHQGILGDTLSEIASEKFGILKQGVPVFHALTDEALVRQLRERASSLDVEVVNARNEIDSIEDGETTLAKYRGLSFCELGLTGHHQAFNAACAVAVAKHIGFSRESIAKGLTSAQHPGRYEVVSVKPRIILDGAHNPEGVEALCQQLQKERDVTVLVSVLADKDREAIVGALERVGDVFETTFDFPRARSEADLRNDGARYVDWKQWLNEWQEKNEQGTLIVTGSLYFISEVRSWLTRSK